LREENVRILIVDDDESITSSLSMLLDANGYKTDVAHTGKEAIEKANKSIYNLVVLDIKLPDVEGTRLLTSLRETSPKMRKIMLTGFPQLGNAVDSLNYGADAYLTKPVDPAKLLETIKAKIEEQKAAEVATEENIAVFLKSKAEKLLMEHE
jgi:two-component system alkaline phosphatase synthesis response regulator PhoP